MLDAHVLVLNRLWQAIHVTVARRAFTLLYLGRAKALDRDYVTHDWEDWLAHSELDGDDGADYVHGLDFKLRVPRVVQLVHYDRVPRSTIKFTRANIYLRDRYRCQYCGRRGKPGELNIDHILPRSRGGDSTWENVVVACVPCNRRKGDELPEEAGMVPMRRPQRPRWHPAVNLQIGGRIHPEWQPFLRLTQPGNG